MLALLKKTYDQTRQHIKKQRHYFANKGPSSPSFGFPIVMYGYENWTIKRAEHWSIDIFELWCWKRLLRVPWTERRWNQSIIKEISPEYSLEGRTLKLQYFGHLMQRAYQLEKPLMLGKIEDRRRRWWQNEIVGWHHQLDGREFEQAPGVCRGLGSLAAVHRVAGGWTWLIDWTTTVQYSIFNILSH